MRGKLYENKEEGRSPAVDGCLKENGKRIVEGGKYALSPSRCDGKLRGGRKI